MKRGGLHPSTKIHTLDGSVRLDAFDRKGNKVLSRTAGGNLIFARILRVQTVKKPAVHITFDQDDPLTCSTDQLLYLYGMIPRAAEHLRPDDRLMIFSRYQATGKGYIEISMTGQKRGVLEHVFVMENVLGRPVEFPLENVHHKDEDKENNVRSNLEILTSRAHKSHHTRGRQNPVFRIRDRRMWARKVGLANRKPKKDIPILYILQVGRRFEHRYQMALSRVNWDRVRKQYGLSVPSSGAITSRYRFESWEVFKKQCSVNHKVVAVKKMGTVSLLQIITELNMPIFLSNHILVSPRWG